MNWIKIDSTDTLDEMMNSSNEEKVLIFKFSPSCSVSYVVRNLLEREWNEKEMNMKTYMVDVISNRDISKKIEKEFKVRHESPQALIIEKSKPVFSADHGRILFSEIRKYAN